MVPMACSVGIPRAWWNAAQVLLDELIYPEKCWHKVRFDTLACSVSHSNPVGADSVPVNRIVAAVCIRARAQRRLRRSGWAVAIAISLDSKTHTVRCTTGQNRCTLKGQSRALGVHSPVGRRIWQSTPQVANGRRSSDGASRYQHSPGARPGGRHS